MEQAAFFVIPSLEIISKKFLALLSRLGPCEI
jgi:hypothetical protein